MARICGIVADTLPLTLFLALSLRYTAACPCANGGECIAVCWGLWPGRPAWSILGAGRVSMRAAARALRACIHIPVHRPSVPARHMHAQARHCVYACMPRTNHQFSSFMHAHKSFFCSPVAKQASFMNTKKGQHQRRVPPCTHAAAGLSGHTKAKGHSPHTKAKGQ